jgi:hypothetical protein
MMLETVAGAVGVAEAEEEVVVEEEERMRCKFSTSNRRE